MHLVTGGSGFIGSNIVSDLVKQGQAVAVCDWFGSEDKWKNLRRHLLHDVVAPEQLSAWLEQHGDALTSIIHMGAISATTASDVDLVLASNFTLSQQLWRFCADQDIPFIYASSAATYGDGANGFSDQTDDAYMASLMPLNPYGWSKHLFDRWVLAQVAMGAKQPSKWAGLKFFNVYGPNEYHKGSMKSVIAQNYANIIAGAPIRLFKSYHDDYPDGGQVRDFIYVEDCTKLICWMLNAKFDAGIYNVGTGKARSWVDLANAMFASIGQAPNIEFIDMPIEIRDRYQYFTEASTGKLQAAGYELPPTSLEAGIDTYISSYLCKEDGYR